MDFHFKIISTLTKLLDNQFKILGFKFGLDPILGLIPGFGDIIPFILSLYAIFIATQLKIPQREINNMIGNVILDLLAGSIPVLGDIFDFAYKSNSRNLQILKKYAPSKYFEGELVE